MLKPYSLQRCGFPIHNDHHCFLGSILLKQSSRWVSLWSHMLNPDGSVLDNKLGILLCWTHSVPEWLSCKNSIAVLITYYIIPIIKLKSILPGDLTGIMMACLGWQSDQFSRRDQRAGLDAASSRNKPVFRTGQNGCTSQLPSGKRLHNYGKSPFSMGKSTMSMVIFNSYVKLPEGMFNQHEGWTTTNGFHDWWKKPAVPDEFGKELADFTGISQGIRIYCGWLRYPAVALMVLSH